MTIIDWNSPEVLNMLKEAAEEIQRAEEQEEALSNIVFKVMRKYGYLEDSGDDFTKYEGDCELVIQFDSDYKMCDHFVCPPRIFSSDDMRDVESAFNTLQEDVKNISLEIEEEKKKCQI